MLHQLHLRPPLVVLVPDTFLSSQDSTFVNSASGATIERKGKGTLTATTSLLVDYVREEFPCAAMEPVGRRYWNDGSLACIEFGYVGLEFCSSVWVL